MNKLYYDLHTHSSLSPCADNDNTPNNLCGMAHLCKIDILALCDHNSARNCPAFFKAAERYNIIPVAGMELTTAEDIHIICIFEHLENALKFNDYIDKKRTLIKNREDIFGNQYILDENDNIVKTEEYLLSNATTVTCEEVKPLAESFGGTAYPAHIDRQSNGIISVLGTVPQSMDFKTVEINRKEAVLKTLEEHSLKEKNIVISSDAHYLTDLKDKENYYLFNANKKNPNAVRKELLEILKGTRK